MRVYISSPFLDLKGCRSKAYDALRRIGVDAIGMEDYVASDDRPVDKCLGDVRRCDAYVGLLAWRYGYVPDDAKCSVTELEYQTAVHERIPQLLFLLHPDAPWPRANVDRDPARIDALRGEWEKNRIVSHFQTCDELGALVTAAVARRLLEERETRSAPPVHDEDEERKSLQLQLDEIKRQLEMINARIGSAGASGERTGTTADEVLTELLAPNPPSVVVRAPVIDVLAPPPAPTPANNTAARPPELDEITPSPDDVVLPRSTGGAAPQPVRRAPAPAPAVEPVSAKARRSTRAWALGGTAVALAATLLIAVRFAGNGPFAFGGDTPSQITTAPADTMSSRPDSGRVDTASAGQIVSRRFSPPLWLTTGIVLVVLLGSGLYAVVRPRRRPAPPVEDYEFPVPPHSPRISNRPARRSSAPPITELSDVNRRFLDETQRQVEARLQALGKPGAG